MKKVIFITNIPNPYRVPLFNEISRQLKEINVAVKFVFGAQGYERRKFTLDVNEINFEYEVLNDKAHTLSKDGERTIFLYKGLLKLLRREAPDAVIVAGFSSATIKVLTYKMMTGTPYVIYSGSIETALRNTGLVRKVQRSVLLKKAAAFVAYGSKAKQYLENRGAVAEKIFIGRNTVDTTFFADRTKAIRESEPAPSRVMHLTFVGYLVPRKNVQLLLEAIKMVATRRSDFILDVLGDGIDKSELVQYVAANNLGEVVQFHGFRQKGELPAFFAKSSGFLFQTDFDIWGLVLNEAMAAGLPCLASPNAGATYDLVTEGETGFVVDLGNTHLAAEKISWLLDHKTEAAAMGARASQFIRIEVNLAKAANAFKDALQCVWNPK